MSGYTNQREINFFPQTNLTANFVDLRKVVATGGFSTVSIDIIYNRGAAEANSRFEMQIETSINGVDGWVPLAIDETTTISTVTPRVWVGTASVNVLVDIAYRFMRISFREALVSANPGNVAVNLTLSGV